MTYLVLSTIFLSWLLMSCQLVDNRIHGSFNGDSTTIIEPPNHATIINYNFEPKLYKDQSVVSVIPTSDGEVLGYSISPSLPDGLQLDPVTGEISGTPTSYSATTTYTITASTTEGDITNDISLSVNLKLTVAGGDPLPDLGDSNIGDGICDAGGGNGCTLRAAFEEADAYSGQPSTLITIPAGTFTFTSEITLDGATNIDAVGQGVGSTILSGNNSNRTFFINNAGFTFKSYNFSDITIQDSNTSDGMGAIAIRNYDFLNLKNCEFKNNTSSTAGLWQGGAAIFNYNAFLNVDNCSFTNNTVTNATGGGGAILIYSGSASATIKNSYFSLNQAYYGGAIYVKNANLSIEDSQLTNNISFYIGGAIAAEDSNLNIIRSIINLNTASTDGGGIYGDDTVFDISHSLMMDNTATSGNGGGFLLGYSATSQLSNTTFYNNSAGTSGGALYIRETISSTSAVNLQNITATANFAGTNGGGIFVATNGSFADVNIKGSIISNSTAPEECFVEAGNSLNTNGFNIDSDNTCNLSAGSNDIPNTDPLLVAGGPQDNGGPTKTILLQIGSPARDVIPSGDCTTDDQRGLARPGNSPSDTFCDIGATEMQNGE